MQETDSQYETHHESQHESKTRLLDAAMHVIRAKGYSAMRVEDVCKEAGLTKGSFFHHFKSKEDLALEAAAHFASYADKVFATALPQTVRSVGAPARIH